MRKKSEKSISQSLRELIEGGEKEYANDKLAKEQPDIHPVAKDYYNKKLTLNQYVHDYGGFILNGFLIMSPDGIKSFEKTCPTGVMLKRELGLIYSFNILP